MTRVVNALKQRASHGGELGNGAAKALRKSAGHGVASSLQRRVGKAGSAPDRACNGWSSRVSRRRADADVGGRRRDGRVEAQQFALGSRQWDVGELVFGPDKWQAGHADLDEWDELGDEPCPAEI